MQKSDIYHKVDILGKGFGIVSSQAITSGSKIVSETPLVIVPEQFTQNAILSQLQQLGPEQRASFFTLKNTFTNLQPVEGIVKTNAMPLGKGSARGAIFPICSLFNHSCTANAAYHWNDDIGEEKVFALKNIEHGEEVTVSYLSDEDWTLPSKERKAKIAQEYDFDCRCIRCACEDAVEQEKSDKRRTRLGSIDKSIGNGIMITTNPSKALSFCREALTLLEEEGESSPRTEVVFYDAFQICVAHGDLARASRFAELTLEAKQSWQGNDAPGMQEMVRYVKRPESHPLASHTKRWRSEAVGCKRPSYWNSTDWLWRRTS